MVNGNPEPRAVSPVLGAAARFGIATRDDPYNAIDEALAGVEGLERVDLALLFVSARLARFLPAIVSRVHRSLNPVTMAGCTGSSIFAAGSAKPHGPAIALLALQLPGAKTTTVRLGEWLRDAEDDPQRWRAALDLDPADVNGMLLLVDPFRTDAQSLLSGLHHAYPRAAIAGGVALGSVQHRQTWIVSGEEIAGEGGVAIAIGGDYTVTPSISQGCSPIGETWTITGANKQWIESIGNRRAMDVLLDTLRTLPADRREGARRNLFAGLAADEYRDTYGRGDFLIRGIAGVERDSGAIALNALPRLGQTIQFQMRDTQSAGDDLAAALDRASAAMPGPLEPVAAILCASGDRHDTAEAVENPDVSAINERFPGVPIVGMATSGEIAPVADRPFLHGFSAAMAFISRTAQFQSLASTTGWG